MPPRKILGANAPTPGYFVLFAPEPAEATAKINALAAEGWRVISTAAESCNSTADGGLWVTLERYG